jgi:hypothetical protein
VALNNGLRAHIERSEPSSVSAGQPAQTQTVQALCKRQRVRELHSRVSAAEPKALGRYQSRVFASAILGLGF